MLFVPDLTLTLISASELCADGFVALFEENTVYVYEDRTQSVCIFEAKARDGLYVIDEEIMRKCKQSGDALTLFGGNLHETLSSYLDDQDNHVYAYAHSLREMPNVNLNIKHDNSVMSWHYKLGHYSFKRMKKALKMIL